MPSSIDIASEPRGHTYEALVDYLGSRCPSFSLVWQEQFSFEAAAKVIDAMHEYFNLDPHRGAVRWIEDDQGRLIVFTRNEYKDHIRRAIGENLMPEEVFETRQIGEREDG